MTQLQLYINDQLVDLADDSPVALTFQINDLAEVKNQQGNTSNQFKLPLTQRNRQILGFPDDLAFSACFICNNLSYHMKQCNLDVSASRARRRIRSSSCTAPAAAYLTTRALPDAAGRDRLRRRFPITAVWSRMVNLGLIVNRYTQRSLEGPTMESRHETDQLTGNSQRLP